LQRTLGLLAEAEDLEATPTADRFPAHVQKAERWACRVGGSDLFADCKLTRSAAATLTEATINCC
jgi:hypothetical protein